MEKTSILYRVFTVFFGIIVILIMVPLEVISSLNLNIKTLAHVIGGKTFVDGLIIEGESKIKKLTTQLDQIKRFGKRG